jgi:uncharacterized protein (DUF1499 family)
MSMVPREKRGRNRMILFGAMGVIGWLGLWLMNAAWPAPRDLGVHGGRLAPCPNRPNCVNSQAEAGEHAIEPLRFKGPAAAAKEVLKARLRRHRRVRLMEENGDYLRYEFVSLVARFVDDVEFLFVPAEQIIHVRSRVGYSDLGANRRRLERIRGWVGP